MKTQYIKYLFFFCSSIFAVHASAQQRLVMNGGYINITNGANLVVNNSAANAITRNSGGIITEGENNNLKWNMGTTTGAYTIPLAYNSNYIPVLFTKTAGTGSGYFLFSTYHTGWNNSAMLPAGVANVNQNGVDNSSYTIDRFWKIDASGYASKPALSDLTFTYIDAEHTAAGNAITEGELGIQRWNSTISDWGDFIPGVTINVTNNTVLVTTVSSANLFKWWTLPGSNGAHALPVELVYFKGECDNGLPSLTWRTASEYNNDHFTLERSPDGINWITVKQIQGAGNSNRILNYTTTDDATGSNNYYRLQQTDLNGVRKYSSIIQVTCGTEPAASSVEIYPNPSNGQFTMHNAPEGALFEIINPLGETVYSEKLSSSTPDFSLQNLSNGAYVIALHNGTNITTHKLIIQK